MTLFNEAWLTRLELLYRLRADPEDKQLRERLEKLESFQPLIDLPNIPRTEQGYREASWKLYPKAILPVVWQAESALRAGEAQLVDVALEYLERESHTFTVRVTCPSLF